MFTSMVEGVNCVITICCNVRGGIDGAAYDTLGDVHWLCWHCMCIGKKWISQLPKLCFTFLIHGTICMVQYGRVW